MSFQTLIESLFPWKTTAILIFRQIFPPYSDSSFDALWKEKQNQTWKHNKSTIRLHESCTKSNEVTGQFSNSRVIGLNEFVFLNVKVVTSMQNIFLNNQVHVQKTSVVIYF